MSVCDVFVCSVLVCVLGLSMSVCFHGTKLCGACVSVVFEGVCCAPNTCEHTHTTVNTETHARNNIVT